MPTRAQVSFLPSEDPACWVKRERDGGWGGRKGESKGYPLRGVLEKVCTLYAICPEKKVR